MVSNFSAASSWSFFYCSWDPAAGIELLLSTVFIIVATNHCFYYRQILHCVQLFRLLASIVCACDRYIFCAAAATAGSSRLLKSTVPWKSSSRVIKTCSWMNGRFALNCWAYQLYLLKLLLFPFVLCPPPFAAWAIFFSSMSRPCHVTCPVWQEQT